MNLLYIGKDWHRKGGAAAIEVCELLNYYSIPTKLFMVGNIPDSQESDHIYKYGLLDRNDPYQNKVLEDLFQTSNFLILPTRADCTPGVIVEACAFGLPSIATNVGGIPSVIEDGINGILVDLNSPAEQFAQKIISIISNENTYKDMCMNAREYYEEKGNWQKSIKTISLYIKEFCDGK